MPNGWFRIKLAPFDSRTEREQAVRQVILPTIEALERSHDLVKYYILHHDDVRDIMLNFYGDPWKMMEEIRRAGWGHKIMPNMPERFDPTDESRRFGQDFLIGITLFELGSRLALGVVAHEGSTVLVILKPSNRSPYLRIQRPPDPRISPSPDTLETPGRVT